MNSTRHPFSIQCQSDPCREMGFVGSDIVPGIKPTAGGFFNCHDFGRSYIGSRAIMPHPTGESGRLVGSISTAAWKLEFHGSSVTSDGGLLTYRKLVLAFIIPYESTKRSMQIGGYLHRAELS
jgi:hypothetical protein